MAFSRVSTGDSVILSSCEMKYVPAFKPLQGNPAFLLLISPDSGSLASELSTLLLLPWALGSWGSLDRGEGVGTGLAAV